MKYFLVKSKTNIFINLHAVLFMTVCAGTAYRHRFHNAGKFCENQHICGLSSVGQAGTDKPDSAQYRIIDVRNKKQSAHSIGPVTQAHRRTTTDGVRWTCRVISLKPRRVRLVGLHASRQYAKDDYTGLGNPMCFHDNALSGLSATCHRSWGKSEKKCKRWHNSRPNKNEP